MKRNMVVFVVLFAIIGMAFFFGSAYLQSDLFTSEEYGDPPVGEPVIILGGEYTKVTNERRVDSYYNESLRLYREEGITYDDFIDDVFGYLEMSYEIEAARMPGMIRYVPVDYRSAYRIYIQDDLERETSTLFIVQADTPRNIVRIAYQADYISEIEIVADRQVIEIVVKGQVLEMNFRA